MNRWVVYRLHMVVDTIHDLYVSTYSGYYIPEFPITPSVPSLTNSHTIYGTVRICHNVFGPVSTLCIGHPKFLHPEGTPPPYIRFVTFCLSSIGPTPHLCPLGPTPLWNTFRVCFSPFYFISDVIQVDDV